MDVPNFLFHDKTANRERCLNSGKGEQRRLAVKTIGETERGAQ